MAANGRFAGQVALVTGAGRGIGRAVALTLAAQGAAVAVNDVDPKRVQTVVEEIVQAGGRAQGWAADVSADAEVKAMVDGIASVLGRIDILVNNAGIARPNQPLESMPASEWDLLMAVNVPRRRCWG